MMTGWRLLGRWWREETGQDLIEYGLIIAMIVAGTIAVFPGIVTKMGSSYSNWGTNIQNIWIPSCPGTTTPCP